VISIRLGTHGLGQFETGGHTIKLGRRLSARALDHTVTATWFISFLGEDLMGIDLYFVDDESPIPDAVLARDGNVATLFLRSQLMPLWIDVLSPRSCCVTTACGTNPWSPRRSRSRGVKAIDL
jgi:hypothetical protein